MCFTNKIQMKKVVLFIICCTVFGKVQSQDLNAKAKEFLNMLDPKLRARALFTLNDSERFNFNYIPIVRKGPSFTDFDESQKRAALDLLRASLSMEGYRKTSEIMELENILIVLENNRLKMSDGTPMRDALNYHFCIFGEPITGNFWGWRFEGHHISLNFMASEGKIVSSTPSFLGSNPAVVPTGKHKGKEVLKLETQLGFALINSFSQDQLAQARYSERAPREIITRNNRKAKNLEPKGIAYTALSKDQKAAFIKLLNVYLDNYETEFSESLRSKIENAGLDKLSFAWAGGLQPGTGHYYRIQGPVLLVEYDNTQNNANHVHTVVRDLTNDFGEDLLQEHYKRDH